MEKEVKIIRKDYIQWDLNSEKVLLKKVITKEIEITNTKVKLINGKNKKETSERVLSCSKKEPIEVPIHKVSIPEVVILRNSGKPGFLLKKGDDLFYSEIKNAKVIESVFKESHKCGEHCMHMSAASDENGGCDKVRNMDTYIERYPWIRLGYEVFNTKNDALYVAECTHYEHTGRYR